MTPRLRDRRILVVEDEYAIAEEFCLELVDAGAIVVGTVATVEEAIGLLASALVIDGVVLDVNLRGEMSFPAADLMVTNGIPFIFTTGYDASSIPSRFGHITRCEKPISIAKVLQAMELAMHAQAPPP